MDATTRRDAWTLLAILALLLVFVSALMYGVGTGNAATSGSPPPGAYGSGRFHTDPRLVANNRFTVLASTTTAAS